MVNPEHPDRSIEAVIGQLSHAANLGVSPEELLTRAGDGLLQVLKAEVGVACLLNPEGKKLEVVSVRGLRPAVARTFPQALTLQEKWDAGTLTRPIRIGEEKFPGLEGLHERLGAEGLAGGILLPLSSEGRLSGLLLAMYRAGAEPPPPLPDAALQAFQRQLTTALQNAKVRHGLQSLNRDLLRLLTLAKILGEPRELEDTLTLVAQAAKSFAAAVATVVWLADPVQRRLTRIVSLEPDGGERLPRTKLAYGEGVAGWVAEKGEPLHLDDALGDPRLVSKKWAKARGVSSIYAFPLKFMDSLVGVLSVWTTTPPPSSQLSLLGVFSDHAALAIGHAQLLRDKAIHTEQLSTLVTAAQTVTAAKPARSSLGAIADACRRAVGARWFSVWVAEGRTPKLRLLYADPNDRDLPREGTRVVLSAALPARTAGRQVPRLAQDFSRDPLAGGAAGYRRLGVTQSLTLPLRVDNRLVGVLHLATAAALTDEQLRLMEGYGALAARALAHPMRRR